MRDDYSTNSHYITYTFLFEKFGRMYFLNLGVTERVKPGKSWKSLGILKLSLLRDLLFAEEAGKPGNSQDFPNRHKHFNCCLPNKLWTVGNFSESTARNARKFRRFPNACLKETFWDHSPFLGMHSSRSGLSSGSFHSQVRKVHSPNIFKENCISEVVRIL